MQHLQKHPVTVVITYYVLLINALKAIATLTFWPSLFWHLSFFTWNRPYFFVSWVVSTYIYIIKFIVEINNVIKLEHNSAGASAASFWKR